MAGRILDLLGVPHDLSIRWDERLEADRASRKGRGTAPARSRLKIRTIPTLGFDFQLASAILG